MSGNAETQKPVIEYSSLTREGMRGLTSIWVAVGIMTFTAIVLVWDDPFHSVGTEKPVRISIVAGILGVLLALRDRSRWRTSKAPAVGVLLNVLAILAASILLPSL